MTTVGEPIEPDVWRWYYDVVGKGEAVIVDTWWQTENGGFLGSTLPALQPMKPGSCGPGVLGIYPVIYDEEGNAGRGREAAGRATSASATRGPASSRRSGASPSDSSQTYYEKYCRDGKSKDWHDWPYLAGDGAVQAADGYFRILGRIDDVINVAGHRLGTKELESATITVEEVAEAAAVPVIDEVRGPDGRDVRLAQARRSSRASEVEEQGRRGDRAEIGKIARPKNVWIVPDMPKTRSGKIMRRVIAGISNFADVGDVDHARESRDRRRHPPSRAEREGRPRRGTARA